jgi:beta-N-acetylhexosaminidase
VRRLQVVADRVLLPGFEGLEPPDWVLRRVAGGLGGVCLFARNVQSPEQVARLCARLHAENPAVVIAIDEEGGDVTRMEAAAGSSYPGNLALGAAGEARLTRAVGRSIGLELGRAGIDLNLAPVADVNSNPTNPIVGVRSFGSDARAVAEQTAAWVEGLQSAGVGACAKHFPGHGDTSVDSHIALPVAGEDPPVQALLPFRAAIAVGVRAIMSAHIVVASIDRAPATLSSKLMTELLRRDLGFTGLAVSDGLEMQAVGGPDGVGDTAVRALAAGCDLLCVGGGLADEGTADRMRDAITHAVSSGVLSESRLAEAAARVEGFATWRSTQTSPTDLPDGQVGLEAARRAVRCNGDVRVGADVDLMKLEHETSIAAGVIPWGLAEALRKRGVRVHEGEPRDGRRLVITVRDLHRHPAQKQTVAELLRGRPDAVVVEMGLPTGMPAGANAYISTCGAARVCATAAAEVMRP